MKKLLSGIILAATIFALASTITSSNEVAGGGNMSIPPPGNVTQSMSYDF